MSWLVPTFPHDFKNRERCGSMVSGSQQYFWKETDICIVKRWEESICYRFVLSASFFPAIFVGPQPVEIHKFSYHGNVTPSPRQKWQLLKCVFVSVSGSYRVFRFSCQIIKGPYFYAAATNAETLFIWSVRAIVLLKWKYLCLLTEMQVLFTNVNTLRLFLRERCRRI